jgi:2-polyprenyl-6-hydroxyphenyl methylase/3-demethylubiquinone-9 3-methyltransferase
VDGSPVSRLSDDARASRFPSGEPADRRFAFGENWRSFLAVLDEERIRQAERSLAGMLGEDGVAERNFLDAGCGSGLFSLAAVRLGAARVHSFDYDPQSVACAQELKRCYVPLAESWTVEGGSVLDPVYLRTLGQWDIVYSWGVLHHTGRMWEAMENVARLVAPGGTLFISIYNDQGALSRGWRGVKAIYNRNVLGRAAVIGFFFSYYSLRGALADVLRLRNPRTRYREYKQARGMSMIHDWLDWLGGYPFDVAKPGDVRDFLQERGYDLSRLVMREGTIGCNEFVFRRGRPG